MKGTKMPADNKRFGVSRGVCSRKVLREFESFVPVRTFVFPRPNAKPPQRWLQVGESAVKVRRKYIKRREVESIKLHLKEKVSY